MLKLVKTIAIAAVFLTTACAAQAQTAPSIDAAAWLTGRWIGEGLGGEMEEVWSAPVGGQMVGHFRLVRDGAPVFYEIMLIDVADGGVRMRVKHFNLDFVGWEEKDAWVTFEPVSAGPEALVFNSLAIRRDGADRITMTLRIRYPDGARDEILIFRRAPN